MTPHPSVAAPASLSVWPASHRVCRHLSENFFLTFDIYPIISSNEAHLQGDLLNTGDKHTHTHTRPHTHSDPHTHFLLLMLALRMKRCMISFDMNWTRGFYSFLFFFKVWPGIQRTQSVK